MFTKIPFQLFISALGTLYLCVDISNILLVRSVSANVGAQKLGVNSWNTNDSTSVGDSSKSMDGSVLRAVLMECPNESLERSVVSASRSEPRRCESKILVKISLLSKNSVSLYMLILIV